MPTDAESHEEQDSSKQKFVEGMTTKLWPILFQGSEKHIREINLNSAEESDFPCKLQ